MRPIPAAAALQNGVFTPAQALRSGWTQSGLRYALDRDLLERVRPGVLAAPLVLTGVPHLDATARLCRRAAALGLANPRVPISHSASAALLGMDLLDIPARPCMTYPRGHRGSVAGAHLHRARLFPGQLTRVRRTMVTNAARTAVDLARELGTETGLVAIDSALHQRLMTWTELDATLLSCAGWPGHLAAHRAVTCADPCAESALESISRLRMIEAAIPAPEPQMRIFTAEGRFCGRVDFYWDEFGVIGEADGLGKYAGRDDALSKEKIRQGWMEDAGLIFVRWGWADRVHFDPVAERLRRAFARGLRPDRAPRAWRALPPAQLGTARWS